MSPQQLAQQLDGFPEVHWAAVPFSLIGRDADDKATAEQTALAAASRAYLGDGDKPGFLGTPAWQVLSREIVIDGATLFTPNPGVLYPAIYDLLDRVAAAAKAVRPFAALASEGFRCDLTSEAEWLTTDRAHLRLPKGQRGETLWAKAAEQFPGLFKKGEHLSAIALLKRMWPRTFTNELRRTLEIDVQRYVVSTHTLALATSLERWIDLDAGRADLLPEAKTPTALPRRLMKQLSRKSAETRRIARVLPAWLDDAADEDKAGRRLAGTDFLGDKPEAYYAFILMDGDKMGAWTSGTEDAYNLPYRATWHPQIRSAAAQRFPDLKPYLDALRPVSPARHMAISAALNDFALHLARHVVEDLCKGKLIYAGGGDVLAMVSVDDLLRCLLLLRLAYSGVWPEQGEALTDLLGLRNERNVARLRRGHALLPSPRRGGGEEGEDRLLRLMSEKATSSAGAVVAHHQAPLARVLRELRATEKRAKAAGRDAFSINLLKRSGGAVHLTLPWLNPSSNSGNDWHKALQGDLADAPAALLMRLRDCFAGNTSRGAAYLTQGWLEDLPTTAHIGRDALSDLLAANLSYQLGRQGGADSAVLGQQLATLAYHFGRAIRPTPSATCWPSPNFLPAKAAPAPRRTRMTTLFLEPLDVLFLRGNQHFGAAGAHGAALTPPWPSLAAGAIRSRLMAQGETVATLANFRLAHFGLGQYTTDGLIELLLPLPADVMVSRETLADARYAIPTAPPPGVASSHALARLPVFRLDKPAKPIGGLWLNADGIDAWLAGVPIAARHLLRSNQLWQLDSRLGIALDAQKRSAADGKIYTAEAVAFSKNVGFVAGYNGAPALPEDCLVRLGGDGRGAPWRARRLSLFPNPTGGALPVAAASACCSPRPACSPADGGPTAFRQPSLPPASTAPTPSPAGTWRRTEKAVHPKPRSASPPPAACIGTTSLPTWKRSRRCCIMD
ncbi:MAG: type III-B CRISPR-associated protein Cas10/Cmr2 [Sulfuritalea sp.]|nr:type III-B CRISPR-associated protein Cas10/Cmr2 [Sulfuritalea sp.]